MCWLVPPPGCCCLCVCVLCFLQEEAQAAIQELNGTELGSRQIEVREDNKANAVGGGGNNNAGAAAASATTTAAAVAPAPSVAPVSTT